LSDLGSEEGFMMTELAIPTARNGADEKIRFVGPELRKNLLQRSEAEGWMPVCVEVPGAQSRGRLGLVLEEAIERSLEARGACPPGIGASADSDASLSDQLYRARLLGAPGFALAIERLESIANRAGALDAEDSAVLRWWVMTARERPLRLYFDSNDRTLGVYTAPTSFGQLVRNSADDEQSPVAPPVNEELASNLISMQAATEYVAHVQPVSGPSTVDAGSPAPQSAPVDMACPDADMTDCSAVVSEAAGGDIPPAPAAVVATNKPPLTPIEKALTEAVDAPVSVVEMTEQLSLAPEVASPRGPLHPDATVRWRDWMRQLDEARGPKPLALVEQLFVNAYVPLADAAAHGLTGPEAFEVLSTWSASFARSYSDAFDALRLRGKRPMMVLDVVDVSIRLARLHGARSVQLVLVDGLRFELGLRVEERMRIALNQQATMTERLVLWSALPSTTATQLDLIARGPEGLKDFVPAADSNDFVAHGRAASTLRRVKAGNREVLKLDLVESRLSEPGIGRPERLDELADGVAQALSASLMKLAPRTLAMVFGDHGFSVDSKAIDTAQAQHGGASPDEILVPAFAWLVGATH
jgi:hypothetical protein